MEQLNPKMANGGPEYQLLDGSESYGGYGAFGIKVYIAVGHDISEDEKKAGYEVRRILEKAITHTTLALDPRWEKVRADERAECLSCFEQPISVEEIPHLYGSFDHFAFLRGYRVTTARGIFIIGWRKRVISIDWSASDIKTTAQDLFPDEEVTKGQHSIHAWSVETAREYVHTIMAAD